MMFRSTWPATAFVWTLSTIGLASPAQAQGKWSVAPPASWVETVIVPEAVVKTPEEASSGIHYLLADDQINVANGSSERYRHWAWKILSTSGLEHASELRMHFDPSYERLVIHHVRLMRDGRNVGTWSKQDVKIIQDEDRLDQRIYDESLTALVFLKDVRPGDIVDYAYTVQGQNPVLEGRFVGSFQMAYSVPISLVHNRVLWPKARTLHYKGHPVSIEPKILPHGDRVSYVWEQRDVQATVVEDRLPGWHESQPWLQLSEFDSWAEVASWSARLFESSNRPSSALDRLAAPWKKLATEEERARMAVRMVQDDVRYLGIEIGENSHQPHAPGDVLAQRFGDCKDKALLLTVLLRKVGIEAVPVLVNTEAGHGLDEWLPTPFAFDHAIVRAKVDGKTLWIDGTRSLQGGTLTATAPPGFERALVVRDGETGLTPIELDVPAEPTFLVEETYTAPQPGKAGQLRVLTTYTRDEADSIRATLSDESPISRANGYLNFYANKNPRIRALEAPVVHDSRATNTVKVAEHYELPGFWGRGERWLRAWPVIDRVAKPSTTLRASPLQFDHPVRVRYRLTLEGLGAQADVPEPETVIDSAFRYSRTAETKGNALVITYDYASLANAVAAADVPEHLAHLDEVYDSAAYYLEPPERSAPGARSSGRTPFTSGNSHQWLGVLIFGALLMALVTVALSSLRDRQRRAAFVRGRRHTEGATPESALRMPRPTDLRRRIDLIPCECGGAIHGDGERTECRYDGRLMTIVARHCASCARPQVLYVDVPLGDASGR